MADARGACGECIRFRGALDGAEPEYDRPGDCRSSFDRGVAALSLQQKLGLRAERLADRGAGRGVAVSAALTAADYD